MDREAIIGFADHDGRAAAPNGRGILGRIGVLGSAALLLLGGLFLGSLAAPVSADEEASRSFDFEAMVEAHDQAARDRDANKVMDRLEAMVALYDELEKSEQKSVRIRIAKALKSRSENIQRVAIKAVCKTRCETMGRQLKNFLKLKDRGKQPKFLPEVIDAIRATKPSNAVSPLLKIASDSRHAPTCVLALKGLASYGTERRYRAKILDTVIGMVRKDKPGLKGRNHDDAYGPHSGEASRNRWHMLSGPMVEMANEMTGQQISDAEAWFDLWSEYKRKPDELFENDGA